MSIMAIADPEPEDAPMTTCFVIAPIGNEHAPDGSPELLAFEENLEIYEKVILPACAKHGIVPVRADGIADSGEITEQICRHVLQEAIAGFMGLISEVALQMGPVMERASQPGASMGAWLPAMTELAKAVAEPASGLREACTRFAGQMVEMDAAVQSAFEVIEVMPREQRADLATGFLEQMVGIAESTHEVIGVLGEVEVGMRWVMKMSRELRAPGRDISAAVKQVRGVMTRIADWERRARALI
jgi:hypothetical protein